MWYCFGSMEPAGIKGLCLLVEAWHCSRPGEASSECVMFIGVETPGFKLSWIEGEA